MLEEWRKQEQSWSARAADIINRNKLMKVDDLKDFIKFGDKLNIALNAESKELLSRLKVELKTANKWLQRFSKHISEDINDLLSESKDICVNLSEQVDSVSQLSRTYCLCRNLYHGQMVGCDLCDDWYHLHCVG